MPAPPPSIFGTTPAASFVVVSPTTITAVSPPHGAATVDVTVSNAGQASVATASDQFQFAVRGPVNVQISPATDNAPENQPIVLFATFNDLDSAPNVTDTWTVTAPDGTTATTTRSPSILSGEGSDNFHFTPTQIGTYTIALLAGDATSGASGSAHATVVVSPGPTDVQISPATGSLAVGQSLALSGSFIDADPNPSVTDTWTIIGHSRRHGRQFDRHADADDRQHPRN